jgi:hypothetical protein
VCSKGCFAAHARAGAAKAGVSYESELSNYYCLSCFDERGMAGQSPEYPTQ